MLVRGLIHCTLWLDDCMPFGIWFGDRDRQAGLNCTGHCSQWGSVCSPKVCLNTLQGLWKEIQILPNYSVRLKSRMCSLCSKFGQPINWHLFTRKPSSKVSFPSPLLWCQLRRHAAYIGRVVLHSVWGRFIHLRWPKKVHIRQKYVNIKILRTEVASNRIANQCSSLRGGHKWPFLLWAERFKLPSRHAPSCELNGRRYTV